MFFVVRVGGAHGRLGSIQVGAFYNAISNLSRCSEKCRLGPCQKPIVSDRSWPQCVRTGDIMSARVLVRYSVGRTSGCQFGRVPGYSGINNGTIIGYDRALQANH
jgi:hypothetical protein